MANVMSMAGVNNHPSCTGYDLSRKNLFTAKIGEYLPVAVVECIPGDKHDIDVKWMTRTQPLNSAAYTRIREYYDWYFVPTNLLWNKFNDFVSGMKDNNLKATSINDNVTLSDQNPYVTLSQIWRYIYFMSLEGKQNFFGYSRAKLTCKLLEYLAFPTDRVDAVVNLWSLLAYQKIYQDHLRDSQWEKAYAPACNINYISGSQSSLNIPIQNVDRDTENMFDLRYANWNKDYFMGVLPNSQYGDAASIDLSTLVSSGTTDGFNLINSSGSQSVITSTSGKLSAGGNTWWQFDSNGVNAIAKAMGYTPERLSSAFSILSLRQAEAIQKMREVMQSHQQDYKSQMEARWDVKVSDAYSDRCKWLGGNSANIDISEVVNNNLESSFTDSGNDSAGFSGNAIIKGKAVGIGEGKIQCNTDVHGYLMCIYHAVPVLDFSINGVKKHNLKSLFTDYAQPELDKTGMVSIPVVELINKNVPNTFLNGLLGYAPQYYEYKTAYDECHGAFYTQTNGGLGNWITPIDQDYVLDYARNMANSGYNTFMSYYFLKVPPAVINSIMNISANENVNTDQLLVNSFYQIYSSRKLDYNGLPY